MSGRKIPILRTLPTRLVGTVALVALAAAPAFADGGAGGNSSNGATGGAGGSSNATDPGGAGGAAVQILTVTSGGGGGGAGASGGAGGAGSSGGAPGGSIPGDPGSDGVLASGGGGGAHGAVTGATPFTATGGLGGIAGNGSSGPNGGGGGGGGGAGGYGVVFTGIGFTTIANTTTITGGQGGSAGTGGGSNVGGGNGGGGGDGGRGLDLTQPVDLLTIDGTAGGGAGGSGGAGGQTSGAISAGSGGSGGAGGAGLFAAQAVDLTMTISGTVSGGNGGNAGAGGMTTGAGSGGAGGTGGTGGAGLQATQNAVLLISGTVTGGTGGIGGNGTSSSAAGNGGAGGAGLSFDSTATVKIIGSGSVGGGAGNFAGTQVSGGSAGTNGAGGVGIRGAGLDVTVETGGSVLGGLNAGSGRANAIEFTGGTNRLTVHANPVVTGNVVGGGTSDTLDLGGSTNGTFNVSFIGPASQFRGFEAFEKTGTSTWTLNGTTTETTPWTIKGGTLSISTDGALGEGTVTIDGGTLAITADTTVDNRVSLRPSNGTISVGTGIAATLSGSTTGSGNLTKAGAGTLTLSETSLFSGSTTVSAGRLVAPPNYTSPTSVASGAVFELPLSMSGVISGTGSLEKTGSSSAILNSDSSAFAGSTSVLAGSLSLMNGQLGGSVAISPGATFALNQTVDRTFSLVFSGAGALTKARQGTVVLTGNSAAFTGATTVRTGPLLVNGTLGSPASTLTVNSGATLGGTGTVGGAVTVQSGGTLSPGASPGTLTIGGALTLSAGSTSVFELNTPNVSAGATNDFVSVGGNLTLGGTLQASVGSAGYYNLFGYGGTLSGAFDTTSVTGVTGATSTVDTARAGQVNLQVVGPDQSIQFWDGANATANGSVDGGSGTWDGTTTNWTTSSGSVNFAWSKSVGVFSGTAGTVTVSGTQAFDTLQFKTSGYQLTGGTLALSPASGTAGTLNVDGGVTATIGSTIADGTGTTLAKSGSGTLTLTGANTYTGGTQVSAGRLVGNTGSIKGNIANAGTVEFAQVSAGTFAGTIGGLSGTNGQMVKSGAGTLTLTGASSLPWSILAGSVVSTTTLFTGDVMVAGGTNLTFDQAFDGSYGGAVTGTGNILYTGGGQVSLTGNTSGYAGETTVSNFTLTLGGNTLGGTLALGSGGRLAGNGTVGATTVQSGGTIAPGNSIGTVNVAGDLTFLAGSTYEVETQPGGTAADLIHATGTATLAGRVLHIGFDGNYAPTSTYTILTADGGVVGSFDGVSSTLAFLDPTLLYGANAVTLQLVRNDTDFAELAQTANQRAAANGIESLGMGNAVYDAVVALDDAAAPAAFDALSGEIHASLKTGLVEDSRIVREAVLSRIQQAFSSLGGRGAEGIAYAGNGALAAPAPALAAPAFAAWGEAFGSWGSSDGTSNAAKLDRDTAGFLVGGDAGVGGYGRLGFVAGYQSSGYDADGRSSSADADTYQLGLYGGTAWRGLNLRAGAAYAWSDVDTSRIASFPGFSQSLTGSTNAGTAQVFGEAGYEVVTGPVALEPFAGLAYVSVSTDGYTESGGAAALTVDGDTTEVTYTTLGIRAGADLPLGFVRARATGLLGWRHAFGSLDPTATNAFAGGTAFTEAGVPIAEDVAVIGAGLEFDLGPVKSMGIASATLGVSYDGQFGADAQDNAATGRLTLRF
ncbi:autotransporter domain-containing protein [Amorphus suaedae]